MTDRSLKVYTFVIGVAQDLQVNFAQPKKAPFAVPSGFALFNGM